MLHTGYSGAELYQGNHLSELITRCCLRNHNSPIDVESYFQQDTPRRCERLVRRQPQFLIQQSIDFSLSCQRRFVLTSKGAETGEDASWRHPIT